MQLGDVTKTWSDTRLLRKLSNFKSNSSIEEGVSKFIDWYRDYYKT